MQNSSKKKAGFILLHTLIMAMALALSIVGMIIMQAVFFVLGGLIVIWGFLIFFAYTFVETGFFDAFGNEYIITNIKPRLVSLLIMIGLGILVAGLPYLWDEAYVLVSVGIAGLAVASSYFKLREHDEYDGYNLSMPLKVFGYVIPFLYLAGAGMFLVCNIFSLHGVFHTIIIGVAAALDITRMVLVCQQHDF